MIQRAWTATVARKLGIREQDIDDAHQEALLAAWKKPEHGQAAAYWRLRELRRSGTYSGSEMPRTQGRKGKEEIASAVHLWHDVRSTDADPSDAAANNMLRERVRASLRALNDRDREIAFRRFHLAQSWREVSQAVGLKDAEQQWRKAIAPRLREVLHAA